MKVFFSGPNPAYSTGLTVVLLLVLVKQMANVTVILPKLHVALLTSLLRLLHCLTLGALHFSDFESIHLVVFLCIVAQTTHIQFTAARRLKKQVIARGTVRSVMGIFQSCSCITGHTSFTEGSKTEL